MRSQKAKVLHELGGRPLICHVLTNAQAVQPRKIYVVVGHQAAEVEAAVRSQLGSANDLAVFVTQAQQRGTADAVMAARSALKNTDSTLLILSGDVPMVRAESLSKFLDYHRTSGNVCSILSVRLENPTGYGRMIRAASGHFVKIVEQRDASAEEKQEKEINTGIYCFDTAALFVALDRVEPANEQGEFYLTDAPAILLADGKKVGVFLNNDAREVLGVNTRADLAEFENLLRRNKVRSLMLDGGVTFIDPSHAYISVDAQVGQDSVIYPDVHIEGSTRIGEGCVIRSGSRLSNSKVGNNVLIKDHSLIVDSEIESNCSVGPFAHLRMNVHMEEGSAVGNFVEVKKSQLGRKSKAMHLTYLGDATIGKNTNIGAGTITCNYDGKAKHETIVEDNVKIGSDTMLVAPVRVGEGSVTGAGSVVIKDVPPESLVAGVPAVVKKKLNNSDK